MRSARFLKPAEAEVDEAVTYFDEQRPGLGDRFEQDLLATVNFIIEHPLSGKRISESVRKFRLRTFRYNVIYVIVQMVSALTGGDHAAPQSALPMFVQGPTHAGSSGPVPRELALGCRGHA